MKKPRQNTPIKHTKHAKRGLPLLRTMTLNEKLTTSTSCKVWPSLAEWVRQKGGSPFLRGLIVAAKNEDEEK